MPAGRWNVAITMFLLICTTLTTYYFFMTTPHPLGAKIDHVAQSTAPVKKHSGYLIYDPNCKIRNLNPYDVKIMQFYNIYVPIPCSKKEPLSTLERSVDGSHVLKLNNVPLMSNNSEPDCCYSLIHGVDLDQEIDKAHSEIKIYNRSECFPLKGDVIFTGEQQFVYVECFNATNTSHAHTQASSTPSYKNLHAFVRKTHATKEKIRKQMQSKRKQPSVMIIGINSLSRLNFIRSMPYTYADLKNWIDFKGYSKVGDGTVPNLLALLTGMTSTEIRDVCNLNKPLDHCPLIWRNFSESGYVTAFGEDELHGNDMYYASSEFLKKPTDHYLGPFMAAAEDNLVKLMYRGITRCLGSNRVVDIMLDYAKDFLTEYQNSSTFSLFWFNSFSHDSLNGPGVMDLFFQNFFKTLKEMGVYDSTIIFFVSDHGPALLFYRTYYSGWLEDRLPVMFVHLPKTWKMENPGRYKKMLRNANRLTSPYDLHATLRDILGMETNGLSGCPTCNSLFNDIPVERKCEDAGIPLLWCPCNTYRVLDHHKSYFKTMAAEVVKGINKIVSDIPPNTLKSGSHCADLTLKRVLSAVRRGLVRTKREHFIILETNPGGVRFEAIVQCEIKSPNKCVVIEPIHRASPLGNESSCVNGEMMNYCYCASS